jgi:hypothetical protein
MVAHTCNPKYTGSVNRRIKHKYESLLKKIPKACRAPVAHICHPSYLGDWRLKNCSLRSAWSKSSQDPISTNSWAQRCTPVIPKTTWDAEIGWIVVPGEAGEKRFAWSPSQWNKSWVWWHVVIPPHGNKHKKGGSRSKFTPGEKQDPISKIIWAKMAGSMVHAIECLTSKLKALSSNPNPEK